MEAPSWQSANGRWVAYLARNAASMQYPAAANGSSLSWPVNAPTTLISVLFQESFRQDLRIQPLLLIGLLSVSNPQVNRVSTTI